MIRQKRDCPECNQLAQESAALIAAHLRADRVSNDLRVTAQIILDARQDHEKKTGHRVPVIRGMRALEGPTPRKR